MHHKLSDFLKKNITSHGDFFKEFTPYICTSLKNYNLKKFWDDLMAGLIVGIVALPLAIAFGIASGVSPEKGLYTAIIAGFIISAFGGNSVQIGGPTGAFIVIVYNIIDQYGFNGLIITTVMAGVILIIMGLLKLGVVIKFIPYPIIVGYMSGIAVTIFSTQMKDFFGLDLTRIPPEFLSKWKLYITNIHTLDFWTLGLGIACVLIIIFSSKISKKIPGSLLAIVIITAVAYLLRHFWGISSVETIGDKFSISSQLPQIEHVSFNVATINALFFPAFTLAILCAIESLISASIADGVTGEKSRTNMELVAQGFANLITPFLGGIPSTGALARTMTNISNGGKTPIAGIVHSVFLLLVVLFLGGLTKHIPMVSLAAILIIVSYNMSEWRSFKALLQNSKADVVVLLTTFLLTVILDLTVAIIIGLLLAIFLFMKRIMDVTHISVAKGELNLSQDSNNPQEKDIIELPKGVEVYEIEGPFFFGVANKFDEAMRVVRDSKPSVRIIRMRQVPFMDSTGLYNLRNLCKKAREEKTHIILSGVRPEIREKLEKMHIDELVGVDNICSNINLAIDRARLLIQEINPKQ